jgi:ABC-type Fe3+-citrate transport system substrate-binding protein
MGFYSGLNEVQGSLGIKRDPLVDKLVSDKPDLVRSNQSRYLGIKDSF